MSHNPWVAVDATTIPAKRARELRDAWEDFVDGRERRRRGSRHARRSAIRSPIPGCARATRASIRRGRQAAPVGRRARGRARPAGTSTRSRSPPRSSTSAWRATVGGGRPPDRRQRRRRDAAEHPRRHRACATARPTTMNFVEGALWSEAGAGTNAVGTALAAEHAVQVFAAEHFTEPVQRWTCAAAPVTDPDTGRAARDHRPHRRHERACTRTASRSSSRRRRRSRQLLRAGCASATTACARATAAASGRRRPGRALVTPQRPRPARPDPALGARRHGSRSRPAAGRSCSRRALEAVAEPARATATPILVRPRAQRRGASCRPAARAAAPRRASPRSGSTAARSQLRPPPRRAAHAARACTAGGSAPTSLCAELYGDDGHPASIRVEMSRLRKLLPAPGSSRRLPA